MPRWKYAYLDCVFLARQHKDGAANFGGFNNVFVLGVSVGVVVVVAVGVGGMATEILYTCLFK